MIIRRLLWSVGALALAASALPSAVASALPRPAAEGRPAQGDAGQREAPHPGQREALQRDADALRDAGVTGVAVRLETPRGSFEARSGVRDLKTGRPVPRDGYLRLGSITKTYVATVVMQLVGERRLSLDQSVDEILPGVVSGSGNDGRALTVRDLLRHTSGLYDYTRDVFPDPSARTYFAKRRQTYRPEQLVALAVRHEPEFAAGKGWAYSNTNYVLAGMIIEKLTGRTWEREVEDRVLRPLGLRRTDTGTSPFLPGPHTVNYQQFAAGGPRIDTTYPYRPFDSGADGSMTGTAHEANRFFSALAAGRLLGPAELAAMRTTVPVPPDSGHPAGTEDGLGLFSTPLSCGGSYLGHGGSGFGYVMRTATTPDGRRTVTVSAHSRSAEPKAAARQEDVLRELVDNALCRSAG
ncbi:serine hydrolase domain-containing protein [Streptomyces flavofungini]|uniref:serine hydrolase domain-containing protein n=1 Tax=Streptomyces flavofungini TaxID=68200 RepID=UPI0025B09012|nr:serine hydrolase domain-containing protein [Streptomyces flavofungini]WJV50933.1 serine hydrolase domain-containing protein [Streptomyces flavofungini]